MTAAPIKAAMTNGRLEALLGLGGCAAGSGAGSSGTNSFSSGCGSTAGGAEASLFGGSGEADPPSIAGFAVASKAFA